MIQSRTSTGVSVTLTGEEYCGHPTVRVELDHPTAGKVIFTSQHYGRMPGQSVEGILGHTGKQRACVTVPRADFDAALAEAKAIGERELEALRSGAVPIRLHYHDGEYLSGHGVHGRAAELLIELGLAKPVDGWGHLVGAEVVKALGEEFTYAAAVEFARPALEAKRGKAAARQRHEADCLAQAATTGRPVEIDRWTEDCDESVPECSTDLCRRVALPGGGFRTERTHTH